VRLQVERISPSFTPGMVFSRANASGRAKFGIVNRSRTSSGAVLWVRPKQNRLTLRIYLNLFWKRRFVIPAVPKSRINSAATKDQQSTFEMNPLTDEDKNRAGERYGKWPNR
jgi:hypothetical protein